MSETPSDIPADVAARVHAELLPGETIMWMGQPDPHFPASMYLAVAIGAVFLGILGYGFFSSAISMGNNFFGWVMALPGLTLLLGCGYCMVLPWTIRIWARKSVYVITDHRALTLNWRIHTAIRRYQPEQLREAHIERRRRNLAHIVLTAEFRWWRLLVASQGTKTKRYFVNNHEPDTVLAMLHMLAGVNAQAGTHAK